MDQKITFTYKYKKIIPIIITIIGNNFHGISFKHIKFRYRFLYNMHFSSNILINYREKFHLENQNMIKMILNFSLWINDVDQPRNTSKNPLHVPNSPMTRSKIKALKEALNALILNVSTKSELEGPLEYQEETLVQSMCKRGPT